MNGDRCYHVPVSPGQTMCCCEDNRMSLELTIELMARHIATLERRLQRQPVRYGLTEPDRQPT